MKNIITISREFGSGGRFIGETLAGELGFEFYDKEIIRQVAEKTGLSEKYVAERGEYAPKNNIFSYSFLEGTHRAAQLTTIFIRLSKTLFRILHRMATVLSSEDVLTIFCVTEMMYSMYLFTAMNLKNAAES